MQCTRPSRPAQLVVRAQQVAEKAKVAQGLEGSDVPINTFNSKKPFKGKVKSVQRIVGPKATGETCHIIIETDGKIPFHEGQSYGVVPPVSPSCRGLETQIPGQSSQAFSHVSHHLVLGRSPTAKTHGADVRWECSNSDSLGLYHELAVGISSRSNLGQPSQVWMWKTWK